MGFISLVALRCTFSISIWSPFSMGFQITVQYSRSGLTSALYSGRKISGVISLMVLLIMASLLLALDVMFPTWVENLRLLSNVTPRSFSDLLTSKMVVLSWYVCSGLLLPKWIILHLSALNFCCHLIDQSNNASRSSCIGLF